MAHIRYVFTLALAAAKLGISEEVLRKIAERLEPGKEGILHICDITEEGAFGFTRFGLDNVGEFLDDALRMADFVDDPS